MKRILLTLLVVIVVLGLFATVGFAGYRLGYAQARETTAIGDGLRLEPRLFEDIGPRGMRGHEFGVGRGFERGLGGFSMIGFGFFRLLVRIVLLSLLALFVYWLFTRSGWRFTKTAPVAETPPQPVETEVKE